LTYSKVLSILTVNPLIVNIFEIIKKNEFKNSLFLELEYSFSFSYNYSLTNQIYQLSLLS